MTTLYTDMQKIAAELLTEYGQPMIVRRPNDGTYDPVSGGYSGGSAPSDTTVQGVLTTFEDRLVAEGVVQQGDRMAIIEAGKIDPRVDDQLVVGSVVWSVVALTDVDPAGTPVVYRLQVRR